MSQLTRWDRAAGSSVALGSIVSSSEFGTLDAGTLLGLGASVPPAPGASVPTAPVSPYPVASASARRFDARFVATPPEAVADAVDRRAVWGLYCMYAIVGLIYGFVSNYIQIPICEYVFGPLGEPGRSTLQQCVIATSITQLPWNFKVFYGLFLDRVGFFGTRRKGWIIFGWTSSLAILGCLGICAQDLADEGKLATYMLLLMVMCVFYIFADVAGDGMTIEWSKLEPPEARGYILTTGQLVRFATTGITAAFGILAMNGSSYYPPPHKRHGRKTNDTIFPFELEFWQVHIVLFVFAAPLLLAMALLLKDPPRELEPEDRSMRSIMLTMWNIMKTRVMLFLIVFAIGNMAIASLINPASVIIQFIAGPSTLQNSIGNLVGNTTFMLGIVIFRRFLMQRNWRVTFVWTSSVLAMNCVFQLLVIYNVWGIGQDGWFYAFGSNILMVIQGIAQVLSSLAVIEIAPPGLEASVYEFITTVHNAGISLNSNIQNLFVPVFQLHHIADHYFPSAENPNPPQAEYNARMAAATYFTMATNLTGALLFCWFLPKNRVECKAWLGDTRWRRTSVGVCTLLAGGGVLAFSMVVSMLSTFPATNCLQVAGGNGC